MNYKYETHAGTNGTIDADSRQQAIMKLETQFGAGKIALLDGKDPTASHDGGDDPHGWSAAFQAAAARSC